MGSRERTREGEGRGSESAATTIPTVSWTLCQSSGRLPVGTDGHHYGQSDGGRGRSQAQ